MAMGCSNALTFGKYLSPEAAKIEPEADSNEEYSDDYEELDEENIDRDEQDKKQAGSQNS